VMYHLVHAPMIAVCALAARDRASARAARFAGYAFAVGIVLFSFSLYALALGAPRASGAITPLGGVGFLLGWLLLARAGWVASRDR
jgi:uncharacterized membrane protein YgdD (TMEM256/DUF423 family)